MKFRSDFHAIIPSCHPTRCPTKPNDAIGQFLANASDPDRVTKTCPEKHVLKGSDEREVNLVCDRTVDPADPKWMRGEGSEPVCTYKCESNADCKLGVEKCVDGR